MLFLDGTLMIYAKDKSSNGLSSDFLFDHGSLIVSPFFFVFDPDILVAHWLWRVNECEMRSSAALAVRPPGVGGVFCGGCCWLSAAFIPPWNQQSVKKSAAASRSYSQQD